MTIALKKLSRDVDPRVRRESALAVGDSPPEFAAEAVEPLLIATAQDADPRVRSAAVRGLDHILWTMAQTPGGEEAAAQIDRVLPSWIALLDDPDPQVRTQLLTALGKTVANLARLRNGKVDSEIADATKLLLKVLHQEPESSVRLAAVNALLAMRVEVKVPKQPLSRKPNFITVTPDPRLVEPALVAALERETNQQIRYRLVYPLFAFHPTPDEAPPRVLAMLPQERDEGIRTAVFRSLANPWELHRNFKGTWTNSDEIWPILLTALRDGSKFHRTLIIEALPYLGPPPPSEAATLIEFLTLPGIPRRDAFAVALANLAARSNMPDAATMQRAAESVGTLALAELKEKEFEAALTLSLLWTEAAPSLEVRRALVQSLRHAIHAERSMPTRDIRVIGQSTGFNCGPNEVTGILANFGPFAADIVPELMALYRETPEAGWQDMMAHIFQQIGPGARAALPLLKERAEAEIHANDGQPMEILVTFTTNQRTPLLISAIAMSAIDPNSPETRSLFVPMATFAVSSHNVAYQQAARDWLLNMVSLDPSLFDTLNDAARAAAIPQRGDDLLKLYRELAPTEFAPGDEPNAP
jgi:HEAT repeat protein